MLDANKRTVGILTKSDFLKKVERQLILVDHNELSQAVQGADQVEILEVVDHHRIGLATSQPILFRNEPVGSTSTIVANCFLQHGFEIPTNIAGLLLAALEIHRRSQGCFFSGVLVTDVVSQSSLLLIAAPDALRRRIDYPEAQPGVYELAGIVSRKKQLLPYLIHILRQIAIQR
ncbi:MAG: hypothetical protein FJ398_14770 [Verrucomicrobia bacterium]|nr:hypothetical protein [Verrucomicrobiota bacterium]